MMYLKVLDSYNQEQTIQWHVGETLPENFYDLQVLELQADCHELDHIKMNFSNIPFHQIKRVQRWFGAMAQFIAHNL